MKKRILFLISPLAVLSARLGHAQTPTAPEHIYYAGLGGTVGSYQVSASGNSSVLAPGLVGGVRLSPRLALEAGLTIYHSRTDQSSPGIYPLRDSLGGPGYKPATFRSVSQQRTQALTLVVRYTALRPTRRLALDVLGGGALVHTDAYGYNLTLDRNTQEVLQGQYYSRYDQAGGSLLLGPSLRYELAPRVQLASEYVANFALGNRVSRFSRLSGTVTLSARYCFERPR